jgi:hypothetical protein
MGRFKVKAGDIFNQFTILHEVGSLRGRRRFFCRCSCGTEKIVRLDCLRYGRTKTCGCSHVTHGMSDGSIPEYKIWGAMKGRCNNPEDLSYQNYGARGVKVCKRWNDFSAFLEDMGNRPTEKHTIDRIDNNGSYTCGKCPECKERNQPLNCRWATRTVQARNKRSTRTLVFNGEERAVAEWAEIYGIEYTTLWARLKCGWTIQRALTTRARVGNNGTNC